MSTDAALPIGTVTFLFTDIEGSTQLLRRLGGERYADALDDHRRILREAFAEYGGHEIDTQGDSFFVAFRRAKDGVSCATACQRRLADHSWPEGAELRVRMGLHTGEPAVGASAMSGWASTGGRGLRPPATEVRCSSRRRRASCSATTPCRASRCAISASTN